MDQLSNLVNRYKEANAANRPAIFTQIQALLRRIKNQNGEQAMQELQLAMRRKLRPEGSPGREQPPGRDGCWFLSILNGFLLGYRAKQLLKQRLAQYKSTHLAQFQRNIGAVGPVCPMPGKLNSGLFWSYLNTRLQTGSRAVNRAVNQDRLISNLNLRGPGNNFGGGTTSDLKKFIKDLWPEFETSASPIIVMRYRPQWGEGVPAMIRQESGLYRVSHAFIHISRMGGNHVITGYVKQDGTQMVYDSNDINGFRCEWRTNWKCIAEYLASKYKGAHKSTVRIYYDVIYVRSDAMNSGAPENNIPYMWPPLSHLPIEGGHRQTYNKFRALEPNRFGPRVSPNRGEPKRKQNSTGTARTRARV